MITYECLMPYCRAEVYKRRDCCEDCWADRHGQLDSMPDLYCMTYAMLMPGSSMLDISLIVVDVWPGTSINLVALDTLQYGYDRLRAWATWLSRGELNTARVSNGRGFLRVVRLLQATDSRLATTDFAGDYVLDVWTAYRRFVMQCLPTEPRNLSVPCPVCRAATVLTRHADEYAFCLTCGTEWPHSQLPMLRRQAQRTAS